MEQPKNNEKEIVTKMTHKIDIGIALIILSPVLGSLLFAIYTIFTGTLISTDSEINMFYFACILAALVTGITLVLIGCSEKKVIHNSNPDK